MITPALAENFSSRSFNSFAQELMRNHILGLEKSQSQAKRISEVQFVNNVIEFNKKHNIKNLLNTNFNNKHKQNELFNNILVLIGSSLVSLLEEGANDVSLGSRKTSRDPRYSWSLTTR